ncbi:MAG: ribonuclease P protein component [Alphaproteobacteria bacterium]|jgi:ribonuclease P protein component|nr:ribonuclease P protein component [Alphaproteobacteria bacterium]
MQSIATAPLGRLTRRPEFLRVARGRRKAVAPGLVLQAAPSPPETQGPAPRIGYTASKKVGNAVARNRARRRLRAAVNDVIGTDASPGEAMDYVVIARAATVERGYADLLDDLRSTLKRVHRGPGERR